MWPGGVTFKVRGQIFQAMCQNAQQIAMQNLAALYAAVSRYIYEKPEGTDNRPPTVCELKTKKYGRKMRDESSHARKKCWPKNR